MRRADRDQKTRNAERLDPLLLPLDICAEKCNSHRLFFCADFLRERNFVVVLINIGSHAHIARLLDQELHMLQNIRKQCVLRSLDDNGNALTRLQLQVPCICVRLIIMSENHGIDRISRLLTDVRVVVENSGNGSHSIPGLRRNFLNCHPINPFISTPSAHAGPATSCQKMPVLQGNHSFSRRAATSASGFCFILQSMDSCCGTVSIHASNIPALFSNSKRQPQKNEIYARFTECTFKF